MTTDTVWLVTEWIGDYESPIMIVETNADAAEYVAWANRLVLPDDPRFSYQPIQIQRGEKHVGV